MTDEQALPPQAQTITHAVKRFPPDVLRWLLTVRAYSQSDEVITGLEISDNEFAFVLVPVATWRRLEELCNAPHRARRAAREGAA